MARLIGNQHIGDTERRFYLLETGERLRVDRDSAEEVVGVGIQALRFCDFSQVVPVLANAFDEAAVGSVQVVIKGTKADGDSLLEPQERGAELAEILASLTGVTLVRIDTAEETVGWQSDDENTGDPEIAVLAGDWQKAGVLVTRLGSPHIAADLPSLTKDL